jgi:CheY-like chemotaxis protein
MASPAPIIIIEDETSMRRLLKTIFAAQGYLVIEAETGRRGLVEAGMRKPDLVILDLGLPDMDGAQVIKCLREWSQIPIVVLSARDQESQKVKALDAGADDYQEERKRGQEERKKGQSPFYAFYDTVTVALFTGTMGSSVEAGSARSGGPRAITPPSPGAGHGREADGSTARLDRSYPPLHPLVENPLLGGRALGDG